MNDFLKTGIFLLAAAGTAFFAWWTLPGAVENARFDDQGEPFFAGFEDSAQAAQIEIVDFDAELGTATPFIVQREGDLWTIPSHAGYPADAETKMASAATLLIGLEKAAFRSDIKKDHVSFGVVNPTEDNLVLEGRGRRVTFRDADGADLASLIIGKEVEGSTGMRYVREPGSKRVYEAKVSADISTEFAEWIEKDIMKTSASDMQAILWDNYSVDEQRGAIVPGVNVKAMKGEAGAWTLEGLAETEQVKPGAIDGVAAALSGLRIVDVRAKPAGLDARLQQARGFERAALQQNLSSRGYFMGAKGKLFSNEGDLRIETTIGVVFTLKFGEIVADGAAAKKPAKDGEDAGPTPADSSKRYLMITAELDESLLDKPAGVVLAADELTKRFTAQTDLQGIRGAIQAWQGNHEGALPDKLAVLTEGEEPLLKELKQDPWGSDYSYKVAEDGKSFTLVSLGADKADGGEAENADVDLNDLARENAFAAAVNAQKTLEKKVEEGKKAAVGHAERFGPWYYVIDAKAYDAIKVAREALVMEKPAEAPGPDGNLPGIPGPGNPRKSGGE